MDDKELSKARERLTKLDRQYSDLTVKQRQTEKRLADEHDAVRKGAAQRVGVVSQLVDANEEESKKLHRQLDSLDSQIKAAERMAESYQALLRTLAGEMADLTSQRERLNQTVGVEVNAREFQAWRTAMEANFAAAREAMATARIALAKLTTGAAGGVERFKGAASNWVVGEFDKFEHVEANPDTLGGFRIALPWFRNVVIHVSPMTRG